MNGNEFDKVVRMAASLKVKPAPRSLFATSNAELPSWFKLQEAAFSQKK